MQIENLKSKLEQRNTFLETSTKKLKEERYECSSRASEITFILIGIRSELAANKQIIEEIKKGQSNEDK